MKDLIDQNKKDLINPLNQIKELWKYFLPAEKDPISF